MKTAALLTDKRGTQYFKLSFSIDRELTRKLRLLNAKKRGYVWYLAFNERNVDFLLDNNFVFNGAFTKLKRKEYEEANPIKKIPKYKKRKLKLRKFQLEGVNFIERLNGRALIGDDMGLGKTVQALAWIQLRKDFKKVLIACPSSLKDNWEEESKLWITRKMNVEIIDGQTPYDLKGDIIIVNYDILPYWIEELKAQEFDAVISDEIQYCKNPKSQRTKAFAEIIQFIPNVVGLSGTPIENDPIEIFHIAQLINKNIFPNYYKFIQFYCNAKQVKQKVRGKMVKGKYVEQYRNVWRIGDIDSEKLHRVLKKHLMIRRLKSEVLDQLPPKQYATVTCHLANKKKYKQAEDDFIEYLKKNFNERVRKDLNAKLKDFSDDWELDASKLVEQTLSSSEIRKKKAEKLDAVAKAPALAKIQELKLLAAEGKIQQVIDWTKDFLDSGEKLIIFAVNKIVVKALTDAFPDAVKIDGSTSKKDRKIAVKRFQNDPSCKLFIGNIKAAGVGLTLTAASKVAIIQFPWNPGELTQAEDRAHRITQTKKVTIYKFVAKGTIEERIVKLLEYKQTEIDKIIDGKKSKKQTKLIHLLLESYQKQSA